MREQQSGGFVGNKDARRFDGGGSSRPNFGGRDWKGGGGRDGGQTQMFQATCADCHKSCEVPFRPSGDKPVYCKECFMKRRESSPRTEGQRDTGSRDFQKRGASPTYSAPQGAGVRLDELKRQMDAMNTKLDTVLERLGGTSPRAGAVAGGRTSITPKHAVKKPRKSAKSSRKK